MPEGDTGSIDCEGVGWAGNAPMWSGNRGRRARYPCYPIGQPARLDKRRAAGVRRRTECRCGRLRARRVEVALSIVVTNRYRWNPPWVCGVAAERHAVANSSFSGSAPAGNVLSRSPRFVPTRPPRCWAWEKARGPGDRPAGAGDHAPGRHPDRDPVRPRRAVDREAGRRLTGARLIGERGECRTDLLAPVPIQVDQST
jgi:hypothetical protein